MFIIALFHLCHARFCHCVCFFSHHCFSLHGEMGLQSPPLPHLPCTCNFRPCDLYVLFLSISLSLRLSLSKLQESSFFVKVIDALSCV